VNRGMRRRIDKLEGLATPYEASTDARERMRAHLAQVAALRRGELSPEEAAEVEAMNAALERERERRMRQSRGEVAS
jgi:N-acyl-D-aspartate/D-glutamate deacylase